MNTFKTVVALTLAASFGSQVSVGWGDLRDAHAVTSNQIGIDTTKWRESSEIGVAGHGISEVGIERGYGFWGSQSKFTAVIKSTGSIQYEALKHPDREGLYEGAISEREFNELAWFLKRTGFLAMEHSYSLSTSDQQTVFTSVVSNGEQKVVSNYGNAGPVELWAIQRTIDGVLANAQWKRIGRARTKLGEQR